MKKPAIPDGVEQWLRTMLEILVGRRKNLLPIPLHERLSFTTPTAEEVGLLYRYVNRIRNSVVHIIDRLDEADVARGPGSLLSPDDTGSSGGGGGGGGGGNVQWVRFKADGTKVAGTLNSTRTAVGTYGISASAAFAESGGFYQYGVTVTPSSVSGNGGDGVSPYREFSGVTVEATGSGTDNSCAFWFSPITRKLYLAWDGDDLVWVHNPETMTGAYTINPASKPIRNPNYHGCMSRTGDYIWLSGDTAGGGYSIRAINVSTEVVTDFGGTIDALCIAAGNDSGTGNPYVLTYEGGTIKRYNPNFGTPSLGSSVHTWSVDTLGATNQGAWDDDGYVWFLRGAGLVRVNPAASGDFLTFATPSTPYNISGAGAIDRSRLIFDPLRRRFLFFASSTAHGNWLYSFSGWSLVSGTTGTGVWTPLIQRPPQGLWYDQASNVLYGSSSTLDSVFRITGDLTVLDTVSVDDTTPDNAQIDYDGTGTNAVYYDGVCGFSVVNKGGTNYVAKGCYEGDPIGGISGGGSVSSVLVPLYRIISDTEAEVTLYRSTIPPILADGEATTIFVS